MKATLSYLILLIFSIHFACAQKQPDKMTPESTEIWSSMPRVVQPGNLGETVITPPSDAIVLLGEDNLDEWVTVKDGGRPEWILENGVLTVGIGTGDIQTERVFDDFQLHVEFKTPAVIDGDGQNRGNSGIYLQGIYELQVLDSYENPTYANGQAGSIYKQTMPLVNSSRKPGEWQVYDIIYTAPKFNSDGMMITSPYVTVMHNGVVIQNHTAIHGPTPYVGLPEVKAHGKGPIKLQDHATLTSYRNIWIREL